MIVTKEVRAALQIAEPLIGALARVDYYAEEEVELAKQILKESHFYGEELELIIKLIDTVRNKRF